MHELSETRLQELWEAASKGVPLGAGTSVAERSVYEEYSAMAHSCVWPPAPVPAEWRQRAKDLMPVRSLRQIVASIVQPQSQFSAARGALGVAAYEAEGHLIRFQVSDVGESSHVWGHTDPPCKLISIEGKELSCTEDGEFEFEVPEGGLPFFSLLTDHAEVIIPIAHLLSHDSPDSC